MDAQARLDYMKFRFPRLEEKRFYREVADAEADITADEESAEKAAAADRGIPDDPEEQESSGETQHFSVDNEDQAAKMSMN